MMKKIISSIVVCMLVMQLSGCGTVEPVQVNVSNSQSISSDTLGSFVKIGGLLVYDPATRIVYRINDHAYGVTYVPYYAPNGLPYRYNPESNTFEEIDHDGV